MADDGRLLERRERRKLQAPDREMGVAKVMLGSLVGWPFDTKGWLLRTHVCGLSSNPEMEGCWSFQGPLASETSNRASILSFSLCCTKVRGRMRKRGSVDKTPVPHASFDTYATAAGAVLVKRARVALPQPIA